MIALSYGALKNGLQEISTGVFAMVVNEDGLKTMCLLTYKTASP